MKNIHFDKFLYICCIALLALWAISLTFFEPKKASALTDTAPVSISVIVTGYVELTMTTGSTIDLGYLSPGIPVCHITGSVASVITNAANGYTLGIHDGSDTNSAMTKGGGVYIPDITGGTMTTPAAWVTGGGLGFEGLGVSNFAAATTKNTAKWGNGTTGCDENNKWAAIPSTTSIGHTVTGYHSGADTSSWSWRIDAPDGQASGSYSGDETFTATAVFS